MNLSNFNAAQLAAYLKGAADRIAETPSKRLEFQPLFLAALADARSSIWEGAVHYYPLPFPGDLPAEQDKATTRAEYLLSQLPGLYNANSSHMRKSLKVEAFKAKTGEDITRTTVYEEFQKGAKIAMTADKFWLTALTHPNPDIRKAAVKKIPASGNTLSLILPWMTGDSDVRVRREAKWAMGINGRDRSVYRHGANASELIVKASMGPVTEVELDAMLADGRSSVRYAAALRLPEGSERWVYIAGDHSARLRRLAAERIALDAPELKALAGDPVATISRIASRRLYPKVTSEGKRKQWWHDE